MTLDLVAAAAAGYFLGGVPTAAIVAGLRGHDIFRVGSGNMGAMNTARNLGYLAGAAVLAGDVAKGLAAVALGTWMALAAGHADPVAGAAAAGVGAVVGHAFSPYVRFRGGKALATLGGATLALAPVGAIYGLVLLVGATLLTRRATLASVLTLLVLPFLVGTTLLRAGRPAESAFVAVTAVALMALVSLARHALAARRARPRPG